MGTDDFHKLLNENHWVQAIHTAVKGRARYKVNGLYHSEALKKYLESKLLEQKIIFQARANSYTGNVLVIFPPEKSLNAIALLIQGIVLDYRKKCSKSIDTEENAALVSGNNQNIFDSAVVPQISVQRQLQQTGSQLIPVLGAVSALVCATGLLYAYNLDEAILLLIQKLHTPLRDRIMVSITFLGDPVVMLISSLGLAISPLYYNCRREATILGIAGAGAILLNCLMKLSFGRARPALWKHLINVGQHSFPSGHAMVSIVIYGFIGYLLTKQFPQWRFQIYALTIVLIAAIGFSRLYLGVHWLTDVTAGYGAGLVWLIVCILSLESQQKYRSSLEYKQNVPILSSN
ncbi:phosphatase PAP2 family protein [Nostoc flagelliforme FACHB-838]|uniref:Phosphatase PAP2 family protein n=1 Tax=Nostoc flagelliforme FACHB-838 TaxID=2692904 RepID=A0ABR8DSH4_9NOSO|nr:phosphatase PAP2 family protein [Nostoc flagelliforme]MBD2531851.1 phosphatase PAP2 family protein [Nostoc flagelliforme FACHB-838]